VQGVEHETIAAKRNQRLSLFRLGKEIAFL
jgi:hypothetical protein